MKVVALGVLLVALVYHQTVAQSFAEGRDLDSVEGLVRSKRARGRARGGGARPGGVNRRPAVARCPNLGFERNHVCSGCNSQNDALAWVRRNANRTPILRNGIYIPRITTVFRGRNPTIQYRNGPRQWNTRRFQYEDSCEMIRSVKTWDCYADPRTGQWSVCHDRGFCRGLSSKGRPGHLWGATIRVGGGCLPSNDPFAG